jgi:hypothetical protein
MNWLDIITEVILPICGILVTTFLIPWLRNKRIYDWLVDTVFAAEELFGSKTGDTKYLWVRDKLMNKFTLSEEDAVRLINAAVQALHLEQFKFVEDKPVSENGEGLGNA